MRGRKAVALGMLPHVREPERLRILDQDAEHTSPPWEVANRLVGDRIDTSGQKPFELVAILVEDAERRVSRTGDCTSFLEDSIQNRLRIKLTHQRLAHVEEATKLVFTFDHVTRP
jgi:hypothetical protein